MKIKKLLSLALCCLMSLAAFSQTARQFTLVLSDRSATPIVPLSEKDGGIDVAMLTCYLPEMPSGRAIIDCPGGGYSHLAMSHEGHNWAQFFNAKGIAFFVLKYRMPNGDRNIPLGDAYEAFRLVRDSALVWGVNPNDLGIMGFSAGGHLASAVSTHAPFEARPNFSILFYPVISMDERQTHRGSVMGFLGEGRSDEALVREFSSNRAVRRHLTPPALVLTSNDDGTVPPVTNGIAYYSAMQMAGNDCSLYVYPTGGHGWGFRDNFAHHEQMISDLNYWLAHLKSPRADAIRVACIGNSITDGSGIYMGELNGYPAQLQRQLGDSYLVRNFGVGARTLLNKGDHPYMQEQAWRDALAFCPDVVVIKLVCSVLVPVNAHGHAQIFLQFQCAWNNVVCAIVEFSPEDVIFHSGGNRVVRRAERSSLADSRVVQGNFPVKFHRLSLSSSENTQMDGVRHPIVKARQSLSLVHRPEWPLGKVSDVQREALIARTIDSQFLEVSVSIGGGDKEPCFVRHGRTVKAVQHIWGRGVCVGASGAVKGAELH